MGKDPWEVIRNLSGALAAVILLLCPAAWAGSLLTLTPATPVVESVAPATLSQGQSYVLTLYGTNLNANLKVSFGAGIQLAGPLTLLNSNLAHVPVQVAPSAPPGTRPVMVSVVGAQSRSGPASITVIATPGRPVPPPPQAVTPAPLISLPSVFSVSPNQWSAGKDYMLTLSGANFAPGMEVQFGAGVKNKGALQVLNSGLAQLEVEVDRDAVPGARPAQVRTAESQPWSGSPATAWVVPAARLAKRHKPKPKLIPLHLSFPEGVIELDEPAWQIKHEGGFTTQVPMLDDDTVFEWHEQDPGLAQYFELRIVGVRVIGTYRHHVRVVKDVLATQRLDAKTLYYRPDPAFLADLLSKSVIGNGPFKMKFNKVYWQVKGFRVYRKDGIYLKDRIVSSLNSQNVSGSDQTGAGETDVEVETSDRWPLMLPDLPNGYGACNPPSAGGLSLSAFPPSSGSKNGTETNAVYHVGDEIFIGGSFNLARSPYASHPAESYDPNTGQRLIKQVQEHRFDNLFIDWGDGTVQPLSIYPKNSNGYLRGESLTLPETGTIGYDQPLMSEPQGALGHVYADAGTYHIKIVQLSEQDIQHYNPTAAAAQISAGRTNPYLRLVHLSAGSGQASASQTAVEQIKNRAYVVACLPVPVQYVKDPAAFGPLHLKSVQVTFPGHPGPSGSVFLPTVCSSCDKSMMAQAVLRYYGQGGIRVIWKVDGKTVSSNDIPRIGPSTQRKGNPREWPGIIVDSLPLDPSVSLPVDDLSQGQAQGPIHRVSVVVEPLPDAAAPGLSHIAAHALLGGNTKGGTSLGYMQSVLGQSGGQGMKIGFLRPSREAAAGQPAVAYLSRAALSAAARDVKPSGTESKGSVKGYNEYKVVASNPKLPCKFHFPVKGGGHFTIYPSQTDGTLKQSADGSWSGDGNLVVNLYESPSGVVSHNVTVDFKGWQVQPDGMTLTQGTLLNVNSNTTVDATTAGVEGSIDALHGTAGDDVNATLSLKLSDTHLQQGGTEDVSWNSLSAPLSPDGDWYKNKLALPETTVGWSGFLIQSNDVAIDLSEKEGKGPGSGCGDGSTSFIGVNLGKVTVTPNLAGLGYVTQPAGSAWTVQNNEVCGTAHMTDPLPRKSVGEGWIEIHSIDAQFGSAAPNGDYSYAIYDMSAHIPFLDLTLNGKMQLVENDQSKNPEGTLDFAGLTAPPVDRDFGPIHVHADNFRFGADQAGWRVIADTTFGFKAENQSFTSEKIAVNDMHFGLNGLVYFDQNVTQNHDLSLGGTAQLDQATLNLQSLHFSGGTDHLGFAFATQLKMSQTIPASNVQVNYQITGGADSGPATSPFSAKIDFPDGQPTVSATIHPVYQPPGGQGNSGTHDVFSGKVDLSEFGAPAITGEFRLGYFSSGSDYWLSRVNVPLGPTGIPLTPVPLSIFKIRGGLGYHMALNSFASEGSIDSATPDMGTDLLFMAGMRIGTSDKFTAVMDGDFTVATGQNAGARMDYHAWLLQADQQGDGQFYGHFQYAAGNFDGALGGHLGFLNNAVYIDLGSEGHEAVVMHVGGGDWYFDAGQKNGPRIKAHLLVADADAYFMLSSKDGLALGGSEHLYLGVGDDSVVSAYVKGDMDIGLEITPQPHVAGDFDADVEAGACVVGACANAGVSAAIHAEALPVNVSAKATVNMPWPVPDVSVSVHI